LAIQTNLAPADSFPEQLLCSADALVRQDFPIDLTEFAVIFPGKEAYLHVTGVGIYRDVPHPKRAQAPLAYRFSPDLV